MSKKDLKATRSLIALMCSACRRMARTQRSVDLCCHLCSLWPARKELGTSFSGRQRITGRQPWVGYYLQIPAAASDGLKPL